LRYADNISCTGDPAVSGQNIIQDIEVNCQPHMEDRDIGTVPFYCSGSRNIQQCVKIAIIAV